MKRRHRGRVASREGAACTIFLVFTILAWGGIGLAQTEPGSGGAPNKPAPGLGAAIPAAEAGSASVRGPDWGRLRSAVPSMLGWKVGIPLIGFQQLTFFDAASEADRLGVTSVEGFSVQKVSIGIPKNLDYNLAPGEIKGVKDRLRELHLGMPAYFVPTIGPDENASRKLFEFAKSLGVETIISDPDPDLLPLIDKLANEFGVNVALYNHGREETPAYWSPEVMLKTLQGRSNRLGACADIGNWMREEIKPVDGLMLLKDRLIAVNLDDRSALGSKGRNVVLGSGVAGIGDFLNEMYRLQLKPSFVGVGSASAVETFADFSRSLEGFEKAVQPVAADRVDQLSRITPIKGPDRLTPEERQKIEAALPQQAPAKPKKPRKLLVVDLNVAYGGVNGGHHSIPAANMAIDLMGKRTGAYNVVFSNDLDNLKYDKIRQFDAVFLNNTVGMLFVDPEVRDGLIRFVREGGGLAGYHGTSHASMDWPEFGEMLGARQGTHREPTEMGTVKIDDPSSPLTAAFSGKEFVQQDEFYRFATGPYSRDKVRVLLSLDVEKTDMNQGADCSRPCARADHDYAISWIRSYGKGRVFYCTLGHWPKTFMVPALDQFFLAAIQFVLGDLEADTTPSARLQPESGGSYSGVSRTQ
jgi:type 1 glutamine amidotransferase/sugar phosphate isomerase/epimerase